MAETNNRKTPASAKGNAGKTVTATTAERKPSASRSASGSAAKNGRTAARNGSASGRSTGTAAEKKPSKSKKKPAPAGGASKGGKNGAQQTVDPPRKSRFSEQYVPYIWGALAIVLAVCFILNVIGHAETPSEHLMGPVGYWICYFLFGCFGWTAYFIPAVLLNLAIFWRRYCQENRVAVKVLLSVALMVLISAVIHVGVCAADPAMASVYNVGHLYRTGAVFQSGGVVGGLVGYVLYLGLRLPGTIVLAVVTLPLVIMCLVGVTPAYVFGKLQAFIKAQRVRRAEEQAAREQADHDHDDEEDREATREAYRARRAKRDEALDEVDDEDEEEDEAPAPTGGRRMLRLNPDTGEVLGEIDEEASAAATDGAAVADAPAAKADKKGGPFKSRKGKADVSDEEEPVRALPLFEPAPANKGADGDSDDIHSVEIVSGGRADAHDVALDDDRELYNDNAYRHGAHGNKARLSDGSNMRDREMERMEVNMEEYPDDRLNERSGDRSGDRPKDRSGFAPAGPSVNDDRRGRVVGGTTAETAPAEDEMDDEDAADAYTRTETFEGKPGVTVEVKVLRSETAAVADQGLSEEEVVLSTAHAAEDLPPEPPAEYVFPSIDMLTKGGRYEANEEEIAANTQTLRRVLESFKIHVREISCSCGPTITRFEVKPEVGIRVKSIANLVDDIAMGLAKAGVRIEAPIPGKDAVGIEVPNAEPATVHLRNILETPEFRNHKSRIAACLGAEVSGRPVIMDINKMPHLLIAGATGMGKSVCINSIIMSILYKAKPDEVKLILIDPKKVEFSMYRDLPHLYCPIVSNPQKAAGALNSAVNEMERRFELIEEVGVRNLAGYNEITAGDPARPPMPQMVIIIDELADLMMTAPADVETAICRLAQKARAAGIHLILGTQRPSVDVITGLIKANIPSRIAFTVASYRDSSTIIDMGGAEKLIGRGDMLYAPVGLNKPMRCQGTFVSDSEVERVVTFIKENNEKVVYDESFTRQIDIEASKCGAGKKKGEQMSIDDFDGLGGGRNDGEDPKFWEALEAIVGKEKIGTSALQRALGLGYGRAAKIVDRMEELGFVGPDPKNKQGRDVLITRQQYLEYRTNGLPKDSSEEDDFAGLDG